MKENREELEARIAAYIDGQLPPSEAARLEVFLANTDPALAQQVIGMIAERNAVRALPMVKAPGDLAARIMEQVERTSLLNDVEHFAAPRRPWWQTRLAVAAALLLILGGFSFFILEGLRRPNSPWRETVMDNDAVHRELAAAPTASPASLPRSEVSSAQTGQSIASLDAVKSAAAEKAAADIQAPAAAAPPPAESIAAAPSVSNFGTASKSTASAPVQITLVARDEQDYTRLRNELEQFAAANNPAIGGQPRLMGAVQANAPAGQLAQNSSNDNEQLAARAARGAAQNENGAANPSLDSRRQYGFQSVANAVTRDDSNAEPITYRAALHPDQLRQLTADFQVQPASADRTLAAAPATGPESNAVAVTGLPAQRVVAKDIPDRAKQPPADTYFDCLITILPPASPASHSATLLSTPPASPATSPPSSQPATPTAAPMPPHD
ncbi:MAG TPA: hypothetical protein VM008_20860 [Phycisphaerae bacterium]|nr:hypothetical protein [Phycisphaerae bacterium]